MLSLLFLNGNNIIYYITLSPFYDTRNMQTDEISLKVRRMLQRCVEPILQYGCEIWIVKKMTKK